MTEELVGMGKFEVLGAEVGGLPGADKTPLPIRDRKRIAIASNRGAVSLFFALQNKVSYRDALIHTPDLDVLCWFRRPSQNPWHDVVAQAGFIRGAHGAIKNWPRFQDNQGLDAVVVLAGDELSTLRAINVAEILRDTVRPGIEVIAVQQTGDNPLLAEAVEGGLIHTVITAQTPNVTAQMPRRVVNAIKQAVGISSSAWAGNENPGSVRAGYQREFPGLFHKAGDALTINPEALAKDVPPPPHGHWKPKLEALAK